MSKKVLSLILAVMMVVTSVPMAGIVAFADTASDTSATVAEDLKNITDAMEAFEAKLQSAGMFTNVTAAYNAYVTCQKAVDAYTYGGKTAEEAGLETKAAALNDAVLAIGTYEKKTAAGAASAVPTFPNSTAENMQNYYLGGSDGNTYGAGYNNILYASTAESIGAAYSQYVAFKIFMPKDITVMYSGSEQEDANNAILIPVMLDAYKTSQAEPLNESAYDTGDSASTAYDKTRRFFAAYPSTTTDGTVDDPNFNLMDYWHSGGGGDANWNWNWWCASEAGKQDAGNNGQYEYFDPGYSAATGCATNNKQVQEKATSPGGGSMNIARGGSYGWLGHSYTYTSTEYYHSNVLKYVGGDPGETTGAVKTIAYWYGSSGENANSKNSSGVATDDKSMAGTSINVVNYKYYYDQICKNGNKMKDILVENYSEGGLANYVSAMDTATSLDPASYFTTGNNYSGCISAMNSAITGMSGAVATEDSADYQTLRDAMSETVRGVYGTQNSTDYYTAESFSNFKTEYEKGKAIMEALLTGGYTSTTAADVAQLITDAYGKLEVNTTVQKVDTTALVNVIELFRTYKKSDFTTDTYNAVGTVIQEAKNFTWGEGDGTYGVDAYAKDYSETNQQTVDNYVVQIQNAMTALRISPDATVETTNGGRYSLNTAYALDDTITDKTYYANYSTFSKAIADARVYESTLATTDLTDYAGQMATYTSYVDAIVQAFIDLAPSFMTMKDGTVINTEYTSITQLHMQKNSGYDYYFDFSYPSSATVIRTTHDALKVDYGDTNTTFKINIDNNIDKENNALDSITINGTQDFKEEINGSASFTSTPDDIGDANRTTYKADLAKDQFSLTSFRVTESLNNKKSYYGVRADGTYVTDINKVPSDDAYTTILATTDGTSSNPVKGAIGIQPYSKGDASVTLTSDINVDIVATTAPKTLTTSTTPSSTPYELKDGYFGAVFAFNVQPSAAYAGYTYMTSKSNSETINSLVTVVDISNFMDLVADCTAKSANADKYTDSTWGPFEKKLTEVQLDFDYETMAAADILTEVTRRYNELLAARDALVEKTYKVTFTYKTATGEGGSKELTVVHGSTLNDTLYKTTVDNYITQPKNYTQGGYEYTWTGNWNPTLDRDAKIYAATTYDAVYTATALPATWTDFNNARNDFLKLLSDDTYLASFLDEVAVTVRSVTYIDTTTEEQAAIMADMQTEIDAQKDTLLSLNTQLEANKTYQDTSVTASDPDRYTSSVNAYRTVTVAGQEVRGYAYEDQLALDKAIAAALQTRVYDIYLNGTVVSADVPFGTSVIVNSDSTCDLYVADTDVNYDGKSVSWYYSYSAPSTSNEPTAKRYMLDAPSLGFIVKGNTYLTTTDATNTDVPGVVVTMVANLAGTQTRKYAVCYTDAEGVITDAPTPPTYPFYKFTGYTADNGATVEVINGSIKVSGACTVTANYAADPKYSKMYTVTYSDYKEPDYYYNDPAEGWATDYLAEYPDVAWADDPGALKMEFEYNERVDFVTSSFMKYCSGFNVYALYLADPADPTDTSKWQFLAYGGDYTFYVYDNMSIVAISKEKYDSLTAGLEDNSLKPNAIARDTAIPVYDSAGALDKITLVGTYALPDGYTMVECGFLFSSNLAADLTLGNVGTDGVSRFKSSKHTVGNQFVLNLKLTNVTDYKYCAYVIVQDSSGNLSEKAYYSPDCSGATTDF